MERLVVGSHPWGRLGGNMLFPVISYHLVSAALTPHDSNTSTSTSSSEIDQPATPSSEDISHKTAVLTFNVRGIGLSQGSQPWLGASEADYAAVERWGVEITGVKEVWRFGYSWGCIATVHAPLPELPVRVKSMMLVSPALSPLKLLFWYRPFLDAIQNHLTLNTSAKNYQAKIAAVPRVWMIYGTSDEFTRASVFRKLREEVQAALGEERMEAREVEHAGHFWGGEDGERMEVDLREWLGNG